MSNRSRRGRSVFIHPSIARSAALAAIMIIGAATRATASFTAGLSLMSGPDGEDLVFASGGSTGPIQNRFVPVIDLGLGVPVGDNFEGGVHVSRTTFQAGSLSGGFTRFEFHTLEAFVMRVFASGGSLNFGAGVGISSESGSDRLALTHFGFGFPVPFFQRMFVVYTHMLLFNFAAGSSGSILNQTDRAGVTIRI